MLRFWRQGLQAVLYPHHPSSRHPLSNETKHSVCAGRAISEKELDRQCEAFLKQRFGEELDFAIEGSLASLVSDGLVRRDEQVNPQPSNSW